MPDETTNVDVNTQAQTGEQDGTGATDQTQPEVQEDKTENKGGPSDEMKMQRLEKELQEAKEQRDKYKSVYEKGDTDSTDNQEDTEVNDKLDKSFKAIASKEVTEELRDSLSKLPDAIRERVKSDPFNPAWTDPKVLEYELIGVDLNNPEEKFEAAKRAAIKSIPQFVESVAPTATVAEDKSGIGNNPAVDQSKGNEAGRDVWDLVTNDPEEAERLMRLG